MSPTRTVFPFPQWTPLDEDVHWSALVFEKKCQWWLSTGQEDAWPVDEVPFSLIIVGLRVVLFLVINEQQRGFVEKVKGAFCRPASSDANHRTFYSLSYGGIERSAWG